MPFKEEKNAEELLHHRRKSSTSNEETSHRCDEPGVAPRGDVRIGTSSLQSSSLWEQPPFSVDERVFCRDETEDTVVYYQAVIKKVRRNHPSSNENDDKGNNNWSFWVHYLGWNGRWDRWMSAHLILKNTSENQAFFEEQERRQEEKRRVMATKEENSIKERKTKSRRRRRNDLPFTLQTVLVDECERITRTGWDSMHGNDFERTLPTTLSSSDPPSCSYKKPARVVHNLPAAVSIRKLLSHFARKTIKSLESETPPSGEEKGKSPESSKTTTEQQQEQLTADQVQAFCHQLGQLFQEALPVCLLYPQERPQYDLLVANNSKNNKSVLDIFGCEYLLRLYVRLPQVQDVYPMLWTEVLVLMQKNRQALFKGSSYREAQPDEWLEWERQVYGKRKKLGRKQGHKD